MHAWPSTLRSFAALRMTGSRGRCAQDDSLICRCAQDDSLTCRCAQDDTLCLVLISHAAGPGSAQAWRPGRPEAGVQIGQLTAGLASRCFPPGAPPELNILPAHDRQPPGGFSKPEMESLSDDAAQRAAQLPGNIPIGIAGIQLLQQFDFLCSPAAFAGWSFLAADLPAHRTCANAFAGA